MTHDFNIGNSIFPGFNDNDGILLCGYEWGSSKADQEEYKAGLAVESNCDAICTFSNKSPRHGEKAFKWRYDNQIIKWFGLWGHPLNRCGEGDDFDKTILQTNWCDTEGNKITGDCYSKLMQPDQIDNFIKHVQRFRPKVIFFFGSVLIKALQDNRVKNKFSDIMGKTTHELRCLQNVNFQGRRFVISFQSFENCEVICLPHPSSSRALRDAYIELFSDEISKILSSYKYQKSVAND